MNEGQRTISSLPFFFSDSQIIEKLNGHNVFAERRQRQSSQLEVLQAKGDADDGDAQHQPEDEVRKTDPDASDEYPEYVHQDVETAVGACSATHFFAEGP